MHRCVPVCVRRNIGDRVISVDPAGVQSSGVGRSNALIIYYNIFLRLDNLV
jgi:hypothetical protein